MIYEDILQKIGLSKSESDIYITLLGKGSLSILDISKLTGINRPNIYSTIPSLLDMGLVSQVVKGKRKLYRAESPQNLNNIFDNIKKSFDYLVPELEIKYSSEENPELYSYQGPDYMRRVFHDVVNSLKFGETFYRYSSRRKNDKTDFFDDYYKKTRDKKQLQREAITSYKLGKIKWKSPFKKQVMIPEEFDLFDDNVSKVIYGNKVAILDYNSESSFIINDAKLAKFEKKIFKIVYKYLKGEKINKKST